MWMHMQNFNPQSNLEYIEMHTYALLSISSKSHKAAHRIGVFRVGVSAVIQSPFCDTIQIPNLGVRNMRKSKHLLRHFTR